MWKTDWLTKLHEMRPKSAGVELPPQLVEIVRGAHADGEEDVNADLGISDMVHNVQNRARTELASYMRAMCMRLGLI